MAASVETFIWSMAQEPGFSQTSGFCQNLEDEKKENTNELYFCQTLKPSFF